MASTNNKLDQLDDFLLNLPDAHDEAMLIEELDGFLTGVIVCPEMILPSRWMPHIWSHTGNEIHAPVFENMTQAQHMTGLIMDHYNSIAKSLLTAPAAYEPVFAVDTRNDDVLWEMWAEGFSRAVALSPASWLAIIEGGDTDALAAFSGLRSLAAIASGESKLPKQEQDRLTAEAPELIPEWVEILSYWRLAHNPIAPSTAAATRALSSQGALCRCRSFNVEHMGLFQQLVPGSFARRVHTRLPKRPRRDPPQRSPACPSNRCPTT